MASAATTNNPGNLPILDVSKFRNGSPEDRQAFVAALRWACHVPGFFYVRNHGVPEDVCARAFAASRAFFALPEEDKLEIENLRSPHFRGFAGLGKEVTKGSVDRREQIDFGLETEPEQDLQGKPLYFRLHGPNQWPDEAKCPGFRETFTAFMDGMHALSVTLMEAMALSLELPGDYFTQLFSGKPHIRMKTIHYPPATDPEEIKRMPFGVGEHKDYGFLSLLMQDDVGGLQALNGDGEWIDAVPIPGTFVVNTGEMLEICTGGYYVATFHRVINHSPERGRISIPYFYNPRLDAEVVPIKIPESLPFERKLKELPSDPNNHLYSIYGVNAFKGMTRSHRDVAAIHYPELDA